MLGKKIMTEAQSIYKKKYFVSTFNKVANIFLEKTPEINCDGKPKFLALNTPKSLIISCSDILVNFSLTKNFPFCGNKCPVRVKIDICIH